jgi:WD40 repeat protein
LAAYSEWCNLVVVWGSDGTVVQKIQREGDHFIGPALAFVAGNGQIAARPVSAKSSADVAVSVFDIQTRQVVHAIQGPRPGQPAPVNFASALVASPDQSMLAVMFSRSAHQPIGLYSTKDWTKIADIPRPGHVDWWEPNTRALAFSPDGRPLAVLTGREVAVYDVAERRLTQRITALQNEVCCASEVTFSPDSNKIAVSMHILPTMGPDKALILPKVTVRVFRASHAVMVASYPVPLWPVRGLCWSQDGRFIAFIAEDALQLWDPVHPENRKAIPVRGDANCVASAPVGQRLAVCSSGYVTVFNIKD